MGNGTCYGCASLMNKADKGSAEIQALDESIDQAALDLLDICPECGTNLAARRNRYSYFRDLYLHKRPDWIGIDFGLGGLFKGLGNLIDTATKLAEKGEELSKTGEIKFSGLEKIKGLKDLKGVYGVRVRTMALRARCRWVLTVPSGSPVISAISS